MVLHSVRYARSMQYKYTMVNRLVMYLTYSPDTDTH